LHVCDLQTSVLPGQLPWLALGAPTTGVHVPAEPSASHRWQTPEQALAQHTPSAQNPLSQLALVVHFCPRSSEQTPGFLGPLQTVPPVHDALAQHTPSTQLPVAHSSALVHALPCP